MQNCRKIGPSQTTETGINYKNAGCLNDVDTLNELKDDMSWKFAAHVPFLRPGPNRDRYCQRYTEEEKEEYYVRDVSDLFHREYTVSGKKIPEDAEVFIMPIDATFKRGKLEIEDFADVLESAPTDDPIIRQGVTFAKIFGKYGKRLKKAKKPLTRRMRNSLAKRKCDDHHGHRDDEEFECPWSSDLWTKCPITNQYKISIPADRAAIFRLDDLQELLKAPPWVIAVVFTLFQRDQVKMLSDGKTQLEKMRMMALKQVVATKNGDGTVRMQSEVFGLWSLQSTSTGLFDESLSSVPVIDHYSSQQYKEQRENLCANISPKPGPAGTIAEENFERLCMAQHKPDGRIPPYVIQYTHSTTHEAATKIEEEGAKSWRNVDCMGSFGPWEDDRSLGQNPNFSQGFDWYDYTEMFLDHETPGDSVMLKPSGAAVVLNEVTPDFFGKRIRVEVSEDRTQVHRSLMWHRGLLRFPTCRPNCLHSRGRSVGAEHARGPLQRHTSTSRSH